MFKIFRTKIAIVGVVLALGGCAHVVPTTTVAPPKQPSQAAQPTVQSTVAEKRAQAVQMPIFLNKALALYNANHGKPADQQPDVAGIEPYTTYQVTPEELSQVGVMATD